MQNPSRIAVAFVLLGLLTMQAISAGGLLERDATRLERARDQHASEIEKAFEVYANRVERANTTVARIYEPLIRQYENRGDHAVSEQLKRELDDLVSGALRMPFRNLGDDGDDDDDPPTAGGYDALLQAIGPVVVNVDGRAAPAANARRYDYIVLYYTASWCAPCRRFTPELVRFYHENRRRGNWEIVVVSGDRSEADFQSYLRSANMPWYAVPYARAKTVESLFPGGYPRLIVVDRAGNGVYRSRLGAPDGTATTFAELRDLLLR